MSLVSFSCLESLWAYKPKPDKLFEKAFITWMRYLNPNKGLKSYCYAYWSLFSPWHQSNWFPGCFNLLEQTSLMKKFGRYWGRTRDLWGPTITPQPQPTYAKMFEVIGNCCYEDIHYVFEPTGRWYLVRPNARLMFSDQKFRRRQRRQRR